MILSLSALSNRKNEFFIVLPLVLALAGAVFCFPSYYVLHVHVLVGLLLLPFVFFINGPQRNNYLYMTAIGLCGAVAVFYSIRIGYFFAIGFFMLWLVEYYIGRCNSLVLFLLVFMSPFFTQVSAILGFPVRLKISTLAGTVLKAVGMNVSIEGNLIVLDGAVFSVDEACMGLSMLSMSMLIGVFLLTYRYRTDGRQLALLPVSLFFAVMFALNLATNLCRIVVLVTFHVPAETAMHEFVGLICFVCYTVIPAYFISAWFLKKGYKNCYVPTLVPASTFQKMLPLAIGAFLLLAGVRIGNQRSQSVSDYAKVSFQNIPGEQLSDGITKSGDEKLLVYVKPIPEWFTGEHSPLICWRGSGYLFNEVKEITVGERRMYGGRISKGADELYTAWWFSNGDIHTISQLEWRINMLKGEPKFYLVNITAKDEQTLMKEANDMLQQESLKVEY